MITNECKKVEIRTNSSLFKYFLDGSRKTYRIAEADFAGKLLPIVAGQIGTCVCQRNNSKLKIYDKIRRNNVLMLNTGTSDGDYKDIKMDIEQKANISIAVERYAYDSNQGIPPENKAIAKIQKTMYDMEIDLLADMTKANVLKPHEMLVIDGSLQFSNIGEKEEKYFYNVIGISKSFNPNLKIKNKSIGTILPKLEFGVRTPVFKYNQTGEMQRVKQIIGAWYLRIRPTTKMRNPLDGIVKIEKIAVEDDVKENGFPTGLIDNISASILLERNVTCYGNDPRWAGQIYPIYLTETALKSSFMSDVYFLNIF
ncbi:hypothetical protein KKB84_04705 [bacterium]|nr:hypothetical protein [bacterium]